MLSWKNVISFKVAPPVMRWFIIIVVPLIISCSKSKTVTPSPGGSVNTSNGWLIPIDQVFDGGPGKDGIPSIDNPQFTIASNAEFPDDEDLVLVMRAEDQVRAYPIGILDHHEIVNDELATKKFAVTYCPLTGTGIAWNRVVQGEETTFGVSGLLYNTNLMPYDRSTESIWSQQRLDCVNGKLVGAKAKIYSMVETTFETFRSAYPEGTIMTRSTGFDNPYGDYPYGDYRTNQERLIFPITTKDSRLDLKQRVLGVLGQRVNRVYTFGEELEKMEMIREQLGDVNLIVVRSKSKNFIVAFDGGDREFSLLENEFPAILMDSDGIKYDLLGKPLNGNENSATLELPTQFMGFWFSWGAFYPGIEISSW